MQQQSPLSRNEFIALLAMLFATIAFSIDAMLPALPEIGAELSPSDVNKAQLVIGLFVLGMGVGTFVTGPLSDAFGRKPVIIATSLLFSASALTAWMSESLWLLLVARFFQGLGAAGPRVAGLALIRDLFAGREMAKIVSFVFMIFTIVPALAPSLGALIIHLSSWRFIFLAFALFSTMTTLWLWARQPETLSVEDRIPLNARRLWNALVETFSIPMVRLSMVVQGCCLAMLFGTISSTQSIYDVVYDQGDHFHLWFAATAGIAATSNVLNALLVERFGMRYMVSAALGVQICVSGLMVVLGMLDMLSGQFGLWIWFGWSATIFFMIGLTMGNLNALALEPLGHIAGVASSVTGSVSTVIGALIAVPMGLAFDGTVRPLAIGVFAVTLIGFLLIRKMARLERVPSPSAA